ncbi:unnamed protein product [Lampetra fluviatilis]
MSGPGVPGSEPSWSSVFIFLALPRAELKATFYTRPGDSPPPRSNESSETMQLIQENKENLKTWIGTDPSAFLEHLNGLNLIPRRVHQAAVDKGGEESVELVLDHCISQGEAGCEKLWDALYSVRKQYVQLWKWIQKHGEALRAIRDKESDLKLWISRDPKHLLLQLMSRGRISNELFTEAKGIRDGAECAELLLKYFIERGNDDCLKLLFALQAVHYSDDFLWNKIRFKTRELLMALRDDLTPLISQLQIRNIFTDNSVWAVKELQARQGSEKAMQHILELVIARGRRRFKQFGRPRRSGDADLRCIPKSRLWSMGD